MKQRIDEFVLGSLSPEERAAIAQARRFDPVLDVAAQDAEDQLAPLSLAAGEVAPPPALWGKIEAAIGMESAAVGHRHMLALADGEWQPVAEGIDCKQLWNDRTMILRCAPGAVLPSHIHDDDEHLLILAGDLIIGGRSFTEALIIFRIRRTPAA
jgi:mannose-6-phosphate isomerase-like protein (cupin superfamily)